MSTSLLHQIALKKLHGIGPSKARTLVSGCGGVEEVFKATKRQLLEVTGITALTLSKLDRGKALKEAEAEVEFVEKNSIEPIFYLDKTYPRRLAHCNDAPLLLYTRGKMDLNPKKAVAIVGTRNITNYGRMLVQKLLIDLQKHQPLIISGLAYGVDICAHRESVKNGLETVGVMGTSLDRIYPQEHESTVKAMLDNGGIISEFESGTLPEAKNFPQRNRIVAGMSDLVIVVETANKGGSMITAKLAADYNRDVATFPGPIGAEFSKGCNHLIKTNQAHLIEGIKDIEYLMGWDKPESKQIQKQLFVELTDVEQAIFSLLKSKGKLSLDSISFSCDIPISRASTVLLELEFKGVIRSLPGKMFEIL